MHALERGISLAGTLVVVVVIAILAFVAVPAYRNYSVRTHVADLISAADSARVALGEGMKSHGSWSATWVSAIDISPTGIVAGARVDGASGVIIISGTAPTSGSIVTLKPRVAADRTLSWACTGTPRQYMPSSCR